jgi:hypothetical protein
MRVSYSRLYSLGNFENEKIECEDEVGPDETYDEAYRRCRGIVEAEHVKTAVQRSLVQHERDELYRLRNDVLDKERRAKEVEGRWRSAAKQYDQLHQLLNRHGVELPDLDEYQRPPSPQPDPVEEQFVAVSVDSDEQICPHCGEDLSNTTVSAWSGPEPECEPGFLCPHCNEFVADE